MKLVLPAFAWFQGSNQVIWLAQQEALAPWRSALFVTFRHCLLPYLTLYSGKAEATGVQLNCCFETVSLSTLYGLELTILLGF